MKLNSRIRKWECVVAWVLVLLSSVPVVAEENVGEMIDIPSTAYDYNEEIHMTDEQALSYFEQYYTSCCDMYSASAQITQEVLDEFAQYAVEEGLIEDNAEQRAAITKAVVRAEFAAVVSGGELLGYTTAAKFLDHSLQDMPENLSFGIGSYYANQVLYADEIQREIQSFIEYADEKNQAAWNKTSSVTLNSTTDLHLAYNRVSYNIAGTKTDGIWSLVIKIHDTYDFEKQDWKNFMTDNAAVTALNNYAAYAQTIGAIVPYDISVTIKVFVD